MAKGKTGSRITRRGLIKGAALAGAAAATPLPMAAQAPATGPARTTSPPKPDDVYTVDGSPITQTTSGSDFMSQYWRGFMELAAALRDAGHAQ